MAEMTVSGWSSPRTRRRRVRGVLVESAGPLILTQRAQVRRGVAGRGEGVGVVVAEDPTTYDLADGPRALAELEAKAHCAR